MDAYKELLEHYKKYVIINSVSSLLYWDMNITMPAAANSYRSTQMNELSKVSSEIIKNPKIGELISKAQKLKLDEFQKRNLQLIEESHKLNNAVPTELSSRMEAQGNTTLQTWKKAKNKRDFSIVQQELQKNFEVRLEYAQKIQKVNNADSLHSALIQIREPGMSSSTVRKLFAQTREFLVPLIKKVQNAQQDNPYVTQIPLKMDRSSQHSLVKRIADLYNYDYSSENNVGRIDEVEHPLTFRLGPNDVRVSVKYHEKDFTKALFAMHHELGHAIDSLGLNKEWQYLPVNSRRYPSMGECYSRFTENKIGKSWEFWRENYLNLNEIMKLKMDAQSFYTSFSTVTPGTSRIGSDELTYAMHIIIRFELEDLLFSDKLQINEVPQAWNEMYQKYLGVSPKDDTEGVMQDLHWYSNYWAYFQGYALGDIFGSQIYYSVPEFDGTNIAEIRQWLSENAYSLAGRYPPLETVEKITGKPVNVKYHKKYLTEKYQSIFEF